MWQDETMMLEDVEIADLYPLFVVGNEVRVRPGTVDPDFPDRRLDGWSGMILETDETVTPVQYLVQWDRKTVRKMSSECRVRCEMEDFVFDQMWLLEGDLDVLPAYGCMIETFR